MYYSVYIYSHCTNDWHKEFDINNSIMLFAQVREDPMVELQAIRELKSHSLRVLCVTSGGCTVLSLLDDNIDVIDCVDVNPAQNYLLELKTALCIFYDNKLEIIHFIEGALSYDEYDRVLPLLKLQYSYKYWHDNIDRIYAGINKTGKFEELFRQLVNSGFDYVNIFSRSNLTAVFGIDAVKNSNTVEFADHFTNIIRKHEMQSDISTNYFYHQIRYDCYHAEYVPPYLNHIDQVKENCNRLNYVTSDYVAYIANTRDSTYDLIQTSNLTDWIDMNVIDSFLRDLHRCLKPDGCVVMRRLNGDYKLFDLMSKYFACNNCIDRSYFYNEVVIGKKR